MDDGGAGWDWWPDGGRTLLVCPAEALDHLVALAGLGPGSWVTATTAEAAFPAMCGERFAVVLVDLPVAGEALASLAGELRIVRQGPALIVVGSAGDRSAVLGRGATGFVTREELTAETLREELRRWTVPRERIGRLVRHVEHQRRVVDTLLEGVVICSPAGRVLHVNESAAQLIGRPAAELLFRPPPLASLELADEDGMPVPPGETATARALRSGRPVEGIVQRMRRADGEWRWIELSVSLLAEPPGTAPYATVACFRDVTGEREAQASHLSAERRRRQLLEHASDGYLVLDRHGRVREVSPSIERLWPVAHLLGVEAATLFDATAATSFRAAVAGTFDGSAAPQRLELRLAAAAAGTGTAGDGPEGRWVEATVSRAPDGDAGDGGGAVVVNLSDVSARVRAERARRFAEDRFRLGFENGTAGMSITALDGRIVEANPALCELLGVTAEQLVGTSASDWIHPGDAADRVSERARLLSGEVDHYRCERRYARLDGGVVWCLVDVSLIRGDDGEPRYLFSQFQDVTERRSHEAALEHRVHHDSLTGLPNRRGLAAFLDGALGRAAASDTKLAVLFLDVDRFKVINDGLGHVAGDTILAETARRLLLGVREGDLVARFGGDEFIVVCEGVVGREDADVLARRMVTLFDEPFDVDGKPIYVTASCGMVVVDGSTTAEVALRDADAAMYEAKDRGRGRVQVFDERLRRAVSERLEIEQALRLALDRGELRVRYQPVVALAEGRTVGVEALVRWEHPTRGLLSPAEFMPAAEASGLVVGIGAFVLEQALDQVARWRAGAFPSIWVAVNLSPRQLSMGSPASACERALAERGLPAEALRLELTESALMDDVASSARMLEELRSLGVAVAIDDFGTGYSSLAYLSRFPVSQLKIDRSFVASIGSDPHAPEIVRTIVSLAQAMGLETCAEGVERPDQRDFVAGLGCRLAQGYLWSPPVPAEALATLRTAPVAPVALVHSGMPAARGTSPADLAAVTDALTPVP